MTLSLLLQRFKTALYRAAPVLLACAVGTLCVAPTAYFHWVSGAYRGVDMLPSDAEEAYVAQIQDVLDGHPLLANPFLHDLKNGPFLQFPLSPIIMAGFTRLIGQQAVMGDIVGKFLFPFFITLLAYLFFHDLTKRRSLALVLAAFVVCIPASAYFLNPAGWPSFFLHGDFSGAEYQALTFARPVNPEVSGLVFIAVLLLTWRALFRDMGKRARQWWIAASAVVFGLAFYTYVFTYAMLTAMLGMLWVMFAAQKRWDVVRRVTVIMLGGLVIGMPGLLHTHASSSDPAFARVAKVFGIIPSHAFIIGRVLPLVIIAAVASFWAAHRMRRTDSDERKDHLEAWTAFAAAFAGAAFACLNQQLVLGWTAPVPSHYHWYFVLPYGGTIVFGTVLIWFQRYTPARDVVRAGIAGCIFLFLAAAALYQLRTYQAQYDTFVQRQRYADVLAWLRTIPGERVVFADDETISYLIPAYTGHDVYYHRDINGYLVDESRILHAQFLYMALIGVTANDTDAYVRDHRDLFGNRLYGQYYRSLNGCYGCFPDEQVVTIANAYRAFLRQDWLTELRTEPVDVVIWDRQKDPGWGLDRYFSQVVYDRDGIVAYDAHPVSSAP